MVTKQQTKQEEEEKKLDQMSNITWEEENFPFPPEYEPMERIAVKNKINKSRRQKHKDRLQVFSHSCQPVVEEEPPDKGRMTAEQKVDDTFNRHGKNRKIPKTHSFKSKKLWYRNDVN